MTAYPFAKRFPSVLVTRCSFFFLSSRHTDRNGAEKREKRCSESNEPLVTSRVWMSLTSLSSSNILLKCILLQPREANRVRTSFFIHGEKYIASPTFASNCNMSNLITVALIYKSANVIRALVSSQYRLSFQIKLEGVQHRLLYSLLKFPRADQYTDCSNVYVIVKNSLYVRIILNLRFELCA